MKYYLILLLCLSTFWGKTQTYFPPLIGTTWQTTNPTDLGWCQDSIQKLYDWLEITDSKAFIVLKDGEIVLEKYFGTFTIDSFYVWNSAGKTLTAYAVGIAQKEGFLDIDDPTSDYLGTGWTSLTPVQEQAITIKHQLSMTSGLDDEVADIFCTDPACLTYKAAPGTRWAYHNGPYTLLDSVLKVATGQNMNAWVTQKIGNKIGMFGLYLQVGYNRIYASKARGMARFGLLLSQDGMWNGTPVLDDQVFLDELKNSSQSLNPSYGYLTWLNGKSSFMIPQSQFVFSGSLMPNAPADVYAAEGKNGQIINVSPSTGLVVVRMGSTMGNSLIGTNYNDTLWQYINRLPCTLSLEMEEHEEWNIAPNPFESDFIISGLTGQEQIHIYNELGNEVLFRLENQRIILESVSMGVYFLRISNQNLTKTFKIVH